MKPDVHVIPMDQPHEESETCWCEPVLDTPRSDETAAVWVHRCLQ